MAMESTYYGYSEHNKGIRWQIREGLQCISPNSDLSATRFLLQPLLPQNATICH
jgi:hypothetical protein